MGCPLYRRAMYIGISYFDAQQDLRLLAYLFYRRVHLEMYFNCVQHYKPLCGKYLTSIF
jgi:hypothetical protein